MVNRYVLPAAVDGTLADELEVLLPSDVHDLEVHVDVAPGDQVSVSGYSLLPVIP